MNRTWAGAAVLAFTLLPLAAWPQTGLLVGSVHDSDGYPVAGAVVRAFTAAGVADGRGTTAGDGTFAFDQAQPAASVSITCAYCVALRLAVVPGNPVVGIVRRYGALVRAAPSAADLAASPYARPIDELGVRPFTIVDDGRISDRGFNRGNGLVGIDGAPSYRMTDGGNVLVTIPDRDLQAVSVAPASDAYRYGSDASGGLFALDPIGDRSQLTFLAGHGDAVLGVLAAPSFGASLAQSYADGTNRIRVDADASAPWAGGTLSARAGASSDGTQNDTTASAAYVTSSQRYDTFVTLDADRSVSNTYLLDAASTTTLALRVRNRAPVRLEFGAIARSSSGFYQTSEYPEDDDVTTIGGFQREDDAYASAHAAGIWGSADAALELANLAYTTVRSTPATLTALLPTFRYAGDLGGGWRAQLAASASTSVPTLFEDVALSAASGTTAVDRNTLYEADLSYGDGTRVRAEATMFSQQTVGTAGGTIAGAGIWVGWQIAPTLSLRTWALPLHNSFPRDAYDGGALTPITHRELVWLSYAPSLLRIDLIWADHAIAASATLPLTPALGIFAATEQPQAAPRRLNAGLRFWR